MQKSSLHLYFMVTQLYLKKVIGVYLTIYTTIYYISQGDSDMFDLQMLNSHPIDPVFPHLYFFFVCLSTSHSILRHFPFCMLRHKYQIYLTGQCVNLLTAK